MAKNQAERQIHFYEDHRGRSPVLEFINRLPVSDRAKINNALRLLEEFGIQLGMPHALPIEGKLWELRPGGNRFLYFRFTGRTFVILHGFKKQTMKTPDREIEIANRRMLELLEGDLVQHCAQKLRCLPFPQITVPATYRGTDRAHNVDISYGYSPIGFLARLEGRRS